MNFSSKLKNTKFQTIIFAVFRRENSNIHNFIPSKMVNFAKKIQIDYFSFILIKLNFRTKKSFDFCPENSKNSECPSKIAKFKYFDDKIQVECKQTFTNFYTKSKSRQKYFFNFYRFCNKNRQIEQIYKKLNCKQTFTIFSTFQTKIRILTQCANFIANLD